MKAETKLLIYRGLLWVFWLGTVAAWGAILLGGVQQQAKRTVAVVALIGAVGGFTMVTLLHRIQRSQGNEEP